MKSILFTFVFLLGVTILHAQLSFGVDMDYSTPDQTTMTVSVANTSAADIVLTSINSVIDYNDALAANNTQTYLLPAFFLGGFTSVAGQIQFQYSNFGSNMTIPANGSLDIYTVVFTRVNSLVEMGVISPNVGSSDISVEFASVGAVSYSGNLLLENVTAPLTQINGEYVYTPEEKSPIELSTTLPQDELVVGVAADKGNLVISNVSGLVLETRTITPGGAPYTFDVSSYAAGVYFATVGQETVRFVKQ